MIDELLKPLINSLLPIENSTSPISLEGRAAVLILISLHPEPAILYTLRAGHMRNHAGEVCFPGGMWEVEDADLSQTALRETAEEIGLSPSQIRLIGRMPEGQTRTGTRVTPYVGLFDSESMLVPAADEIEAIFQVPLAQFFHGIEMGRDQFERKGVKFSAPIYQYERFKIWGFTALISEKLLRHLAPIFKR